MYHSATYSIRCFLSSFSHSTYLEFTLNFGDFLLEKNNLKFQKDKMERVQRVKGYGNLETDPATNLDYHVEDDDQGKPNCIPAVRYTSPLRWVFELMLWIRSFWLPIAIQDITWLACNVIKWALIWKPFSAKCKIDWIITIVQHSTNIKSSNEVKIKSKKLNETKSFRRRRTGQGHPHYANSRRRWFWLDIFEGADWKSSTRYDDSIERILFQKRRHHARSELQIH